ncbi:MAG TPA: hypothetical protein VNN22_18160 [Verrucomicrobiae bacterium]|nr:hypothetical protein [Verrucomicrobiae bacterium]
MREINLPITQTVSITFNPGTFDLSKAVDMGDGRRQVPLGTVFDSQINAVMETARRNGGKILYATTSIEQSLESIMLEYFMGPFVGHEERRAMFEHEVLQSSALSYRTKKELVTKIINSEGLLEGKQKSAVQKHLHTIMEWRNAFAHGKVQHDTKTGCFVRYYSGGTKTLSLSDTYWDEVEKTFQECVNFLKEAKQQLMNKQQTG